MSDTGIATTLALAALLSAPNAVVAGQPQRVQIQSAGTHTVELREVLRIGSLDGRTDAFGRLRGVILDRARRLYVADDFSREVRVFDADGELLQVIGRQGRGPGEFEGPWVVAIDNADSLFVWDQTLARFSVFDAEGVFQRSFVPPRQWLVNSVDFLPDGDLLIAAFGPSDVWGLHQLDREGNLIAEFGAVPVDSGVYAGFSSSLFGGAADLTSGGDIVYTRKSPYEILFFDTDRQHLRTCVGSEDWTTAPIEVVEKVGDQGVRLHWDRFVHSSSVFALDGGQYLNLVLDLATRRTLLDIVTADCTLLSRHVLDEILVVKDVQEDYLVATTQSDIPQIIIFQFSVQSKR